MPKARILTMSNLRLRQRRSHPMSTPDRLHYLLNSKQHLQARPPSAQVGRRHRSLVQWLLRYRAKVDLHRLHHQAASVGKRHLICPLLHRQDRRKLAKSTRMRQLSMRATTTPILLHLSLIKMRSRPMRATRAWRIIPCNRPWPMHHQASRPQCLLIRRLQGQHLPHYPASHRLSRSVVQLMSLVRLLRPRPPRRKSRNKKSTIRTTMRRHQVVLLRPTLIRRQGSRKKPTSPLSSHLEVVRRRRRLHSQVEPDNLWMCPGQAWPVSDPATCHDPLWPWNQGSLPTILTLAYKADGGSSRTKFPLFFKEDEISTSRLRSLRRTTKAPRPS